MKIPLVKWPVLHVRGAAAWAVLIAALGISIVAARLSHRAEAPLPASIRFGRLTGESKQHIIEIYAPDGRHSIQDPPTDTPPIVLKIPEEYRVLTSKGAIRDWGVNLMTYYPGFTSPEDPQNAKFGLSCVGYCNGRIFVHVENFGRNFQQANPAEKKYYSLIAPNGSARSLLNKKKERELPGFNQRNLHVTDYPPEAGFNIIFQELYTSMEDAPNIIPGHFAQIKQYYLRWNQEHEYYDLMATCNIPSGNNTFERFVCALHFSLTCNPAVSIEVVGIEGKYLSEFGNIKAETDKFISAMMVKPACNS